MEFAGSIPANLRAALQSARRLKEGPVHPDTVDHWAQIVTLANRDDAALQSFKTREMVTDLQREIDARRREV